MQDDILSVASRRRIYECVQGNPGAHLRDLARRTELPLGTTLYHLDHLESREMITSRRDGRYKRYFTGFELGRREKDVLSALRHDAPRRIVEALLRSEQATQRELCVAVGLSRSTLSFHINQLVARGLARRVPARPENLYVLEDPALAAEMINRYGDSLSPTRTVRLQPVDVKPESATEAAPALG